MRRDVIVMQGMNPDEGFTTPVRAMHISDVQSLNRETPIDIAFITDKSYDTDWATQLILPYMAGDGVLVSMQNGINEDAIAGSPAGGEPWGAASACTGTK